MPKNKINIAVLLGDPSGIGPELISKLLSELRNQDFNEFSHQTSLNFYNLFRLKPVG